jgi:DNA polymerase
MSGIKEFSFINSFQGTKIAQEREDPEHNSGGHRLAEVLKELSACTRCRLSSERNKLVFGEGNPDAPLVFVGEGPGMEEDKQGRPFVGKAGKLLDRMIAAIGIQRQEVYICNVVKCRPPGNRTPNLDEVEVCAPFLIRQIEAIRPRAVCTLGACASQTLLGNSSPISRLRGKVHSWRGLSLVCTYHPAYLLRNPVQKAAVWQDLLLVQQLLKSQLVKTL